MTAGRDALDHQYDRPRQPGPGRRRREWRNRRTGHRRRPLPRHRQHHDPEQDPRRGQLRLDQQRQHLRHLDLELIEHARRDTVSPGLTHPPRGRAYFSRGLRPIDKSTMAVKLLALGLLLARLLPRLEQIDNSHDSEESGRILRGDDRKASFHRLGQPLGHLATGVVRVSHHRRGIHQVVSNDRAGTESGRTVVPAGHRDQPVIQQIGLGDDPQELALLAQDRVAGMLARARDRRSSRG